MLIYTFYLTRTQALIHVKHFFSLKYLFVFWFNFYDKHCLSMFKNAWTPGTLAFWSTNKIWSPGNSLNAVLYKCGVKTPNSKSNKKNARKLSFPQGFILIYHIFTMLYLLTILQEDVYNIKDLVINVFLRNTLLFAIFS